MAVVSNSKIYHNSNAISKLTSTDNLNNCFNLVYKRRLKDGQNSDIWSLGLNWPEVRLSIQQELSKGSYQLEPLTAYQSKHGTLTRWSSRDAVVLKAISLWLAPIIASYIPSGCWQWCASNYQY